MRFNAQYIVIVITSSLLLMSIFLASCDMLPQSSNDINSLNQASHTSSNSKEFLHYSDLEPTAKSADPQNPNASSSVLCPLPILAHYDGVDIRSSVQVDAITGILFHQASYDYAFPLETQLPEADYEKATETRSIPHNNHQRYDANSWLDASILRLWRMNASTPINTSIDLGVHVGDVVYAPVDGKVVHICEYDLFDQMKDIEIHIQPEGRDDLDCVLIHISDPLVKEGDSVVGGTTPVAHIRDIDKELTDVQLGYYTPEGVGGNHVHIQMNNANYPEYREKKLVHR